MAVNPEASFIAQFGAEVKLAYQAESKLYNVVRKRTNVVGSTSRFQKIGAVSAYTKSRNADMTALEPLHSYVDVTITDAYASILIDDLDLIKTNADLKKEYVTIVGRAIAKELDARIITALTAGTATTTTNAGAFSLARALEIKKYFDASQVPDSDRFVIVGSKTMADMLAITAFTSADFNTVRALVQGDIDTYLGLKFITVPDAMLSLNAGPTPDTRVNLAFHKDALGVAINAEPKPFMDWSADKHAWWVGCTAAMGAAIVDTTGVCEFEVDV